MVLGLLLTAVVVWFHCEILWLPQFVYYWKVNGRKLIEIFYYLCPRMRLYRLIFFTGSFLASMHECYSFWIICSSKTSMVTLGAEDFCQDITSHSIGSWRGVAVDCDLAFIYTFFSLSHSLISSLLNTIWYKTCPLLIHFDLVWWPNKLWTLFLACVTGHLALATWLIILIPNLGGSFFWKREGQYFGTCEPI